MYWVYTLWCEDDSLYTGFTDNIKHRIYVHYHRLKAAAKYTKSHKVRSLAAAWKTDSETAARKLEFRIKRLDRAKKLLLIEKPEQVFEFFPELSDFDILPDNAVKFEDCI
ncbi:MAG: GIY-YIG nuclease family protein [Oscillospiraceae bacterium]|nr:GIY-YIG nuclease family protein [Oscillospiraceae bacterium]